MTATYEKIASTTLSSAAATVTFSSISSAYTDLVIIAQMKNSGSGGDLLAYFNSDNGSNYSRTIIGGTGSSSYSAMSTNASHARFNYSEPINSDGNTVFRINIQNYSNTTTFKTTISRGDRSANSTVVMVNLWRSTSAINNIQFFTDATNFASGSIITIYGIKAE
jgi:hypothetical protein